jgi:peptidoglycan/LPS O-acetylase OafA/YrhL
VPRLILAAVTPDNTPHGYNITFGAPMLTFIIIGGVLYFLFSRPHRRVPPRPLRLSAGRPAASAASATAAASGTETADAPAAEAPAAEAPAADEPTAESNGSAQGEAAPGAEDTE